MGIEEENSQEENLLDNLVEKNEENGNWFSRLLKAGLNNTYVPGIVVGLIAIVIGILLGLDLDSIKFYLIGLVIITIVITTFLKGSE
ncbi:MAG: hypothetical protein FWE58_05010 [Methanobrevibacter sp.]|nr:hypothetical protein [Methanobrevibacter sp.]